MSEPSIQRKLTFAITLTGGLALLLAYSASVALEVAALHRALTRQVSILANVMDENRVTSPSPAARPSDWQILEALGGQRYVASAVAYSRDGDVFASIDRRSASAKPDPLEPLEGGYRFEDQSLSRRIPGEGEPVGWLRVRLDLPAIRAGLARGAAVGLGALGACFALGLLISARLQRRLAAPISGLTTAARRVSRERDYSVRAAKHASNELGALVDEFNAMLSSIHDRDQQLQAERETLEQRVEQGARELEQETAARRQAEKTARRLADFDPLTGLPNRVLFDDRLTQAIARAERRKLKPLVLVLDLDRFKTINDTLGKAIGDQVLRGVAERLTACLRAEDTVARLGADEFQLLLPSHSGPNDAIIVAEKLLHALKPPFSVDGHELYVSASIGISMFPEDGESAEVLIKNADAALHRAKEQGRDSYQLYAPAMNAAAMERLVLESDLRRALEREELILHYQPVVDPASGAILSVEALVRWLHPEEGLRGPGSFIGLAEETGLIVPLGEWVLRTACEQCRSWQTPGLSAVRVSVNVSAHQFRHAGFVGVVARACKEADLDPSLLTLEVTESLIMEQADSTIGMLNELKQLGVAISIDDFGTGYSSLSYLKRLPIDILKIDRSFVKDLPDDADDAVIAKLIISVAHGLRLTVVAEGVETVAQLEFLLPEHCDAVQGYLFSRPVPAADLASLLAGPRVCQPTPVAPLTPN